MQMKTIAAYSLLAILVPVVGMTLRSPGHAASPVLEDQTRVTTLYAHDDYLSTFSFRYGGTGARMDDGELILDNAQIAFDVFAEDMITFGFVDNEPTRIIDLGDVTIPGIDRAADRAPKLPVSLLQTLHLDAGRFNYRGPNSKLYRLKEANEIMEGLPGQGFYHIEPKVGHTYLLRSDPRGSGSAEFYAKFQVIGFRPGESLTIRWAVIPSR